MSIPTLNPVNQTILVIDPSASHLAYCYIDLDFKTKEAHFQSTGMLWTKGTWNRGQRFLYMNRCFDVMLNGIPSHIPNTIVSEQYFVNPKMLSGGTAVIPVINGLLEMKAAELGDVQYTETPPPSWRSQLGIKFLKDSKGKRDYKTPTVNAVEANGIKIPDAVISNITLKARETPYDISDCLAIGLAVCKANGFSNITVSNTLFHPKMLTDEFNRVSKEI